MKAFALLVALCMAACGRSGIDVFETDGDGRGPGDGDGDATDDDISGNTLAAVTIPSGTFSMGSPPSEACREPWDEQETAHQVELTYDYAMLTTEVTQAQWLAFVGAFPAAQAVACDACPVVNVTWHDAASFCNALSSAEGRATCYTCSGGECSANADIIACTGWRLPSEAEWERARRAGTTGAVYANDLTDCTTDASLDALTWYQATTPSATPNVQPTATKLANAYGLFDMTGNAWEWCQDWDQLDLGSDAVVDPLVEVASGFRVARGGGYSDRAEVMRAAMRDSNRPADRFDYLGFRCVRRL